MGVMSGDELSVVREIRETVADQLHDLVIERQELGSYETVVARVRAIGRIGQTLGQARAGQRQASELGLPISPSVSREREALCLLRSAVMSLAEASASWAIALDWEEVRPASTVMSRAERIVGEDI